jgi:predicted GIY-YIG superfamily endonuclease
MSLINLWQYRKRQWGGYVFECEGSGAIYVGISQDVDGRLKQHAFGQSARFTRAYGRPAKVIELYFCATGRQARDWEKATATALQQMYPKRPVYHPDGKPRLLTKIQRIDITELIVR